MDFGRCTCTCTHIYHINYMNTRFRISIEIRIYDCGFDVIVEFEEFVFDPMIEFEDFTCPNSVLN